MLFMDNPLHKAKKNGHFLNHTHHMSLCNILMLTYVYLQIWPPLAANLLTHQVWEVVYVGAMQLKNIWNDNNLK